MTSTVATRIAPTVSCCVCGAPIAANPSHMCINCLREQVDITEGISRQLVLTQCKQCGRYLHNRWMACDDESPHLLALCLKKIRGLNHVKLVDASFIWTEPHSRRLRIKLSVQKEALQGAILQQTFSVEFFLQTCQCDDCKKSWTPHIWAAVVQVRQRTDHKRTLLFLEQLIIKHEAHEKVLNILEKPDGLDFQFETRQDALKFVEFVGHHFPIKTKSARQLVSHDASSNTHSTKHSLAVTLCPLCKDDVVFLPQKVSNVFGGAGPFLLVSKVSTVIHLIDPTTLRRLEVSAEKYWKNPFDSVLQRAHLSEFVVLDVEDNVHISKPATAAALAAPTSGGNSGKRQRTNKHAMLAGCSGVDLRMVEIARVSDLGSNDERISVRSHIGGVLKAGDVCLGYDTRTINVRGLDEKSFENSQLQENEVILVKKVHKKQAETERCWVLRELTKIGATEQADGEGGKGRRSSLNKDIEMFKQELEENPEMRKCVNLYRDPKYQKRHRNTNMSNTKRDTEMSLEEETAPEAASEPASNAIPPKAIVSRKRRSVPPATKPGFEVLGEALDYDSDDDDYPNVKLSELLDGLDITEEQFESDGTANILQL
eukprot:GHVS01036934.1.p1 GENE.GHVS01036934.1~~GHVS01036934.1.p1  ORF type:complete len:599 (+),score=46.58 GHVS01036934.1:194-1990(+)